MAEVSEKIEADIAAIGVSVDRLQTENARLRDALNDIAHGAVITECDETAARSLKDYAREVRRVAMRGLNL